MGRSAVVDIPFPVAGLHEGVSFHNQPQGTTPSCQNVRALDPRSYRYRGGQRSGLTKYKSAVVNGTNAIQDLNSIVTSSGLARTTTKLAVSGGNLYTFTSSGQTQKSTGTLVTTFGLVQSQDHFDVMYYVDGTNYRKYTVSSGLEAAWTASAGSMPASGANKCRLIALWRARIVMSGLTGDEHNWFMSRVASASDFDYSPATAAEDDPVAGNNSLAGKIGDVVTALIPWNDEILIFGCDHSIWQLTGDPMAGGRIDLISDITGISWGRAWCKDPNGIVYFWGTRGGVFRMQPNGKPELISPQLLDRFRSVNTASRKIRLVWSTAENGLHVFVTPSTAIATTHYFWDATGNSWWPDVFASTDHDPTAVFVFDGDDPEDRALLLGCRDGYIREWDPDAKDDDSTAINSHVYLGPIRAGRAMSECVLDELQAVMGANTDTDAVTYDVYAGQSVEEAYNASSYFSGTWTAGKNYSERRRARGEAIWLKLSGNTIAKGWSMENIAARIRGVGREGQRLKL